MKSIKISTLLLTLLLSMMSTDTFAYDAEVDGIYYNLYNINGKVAEVTYKDNKFNSYSGDVVIPEKVTYEGVEYPVESIGDRAFSGCTGLTSITIPNSVTSIESSAFSGCSSLTSVTLPNSVTSIVDWAFAGCTSLTSITIPNSVTSIGWYTFHDCTSLTSITIPNSVRSIGNHAFSNCSSLTSITIPNSVTSIGYNAFAGCTSLTSIKVDAGNNKYDSRDNCNAIIETSTNTLIAGCKSTTIPNSVTSIGDEAFDDCTALTSITIPNSVTSIGDEAFSGCTSLTSVTVPNSVTSIGRYAFTLCSSLTSITIPNSVTSIGGCTFFGCTSLTSIKVDAGNNKYDSRDNCNAIIETSSNTLIAGCKNTTIPNSVTSIGYEAFRGCYALTSITIPNSVTSIGNRAFMECNSLTSVTIPNSVTSIGNHAFYGCSSLTSIKVDAGNNTYDSRDNCNAIIETSTNTLIAGCMNTTIPNSVTSIGGCAFGECSSLTSITIPDGVTSIGEDAFNGCSGLTSITIPHSVTSIGYCAFSRCDNLEEVYCYAEKVPSTSTDAFGFHVPQNVTLYVPASAINDYKTTEPWSEFGTIKEIPGSSSVQAVKESVPVLISANNGLISVKSELDGEPVAVYTAEGKLMGSGTISSGQATVSTSLGAGTVAIVKIGQKAVKVVMR